MKKGKKLLALGLAIALTASILAGCGGKGAEKGGNEKAAGDKGQMGALMFGQGADPRGLDPGMVDDGESSKVMCQIYESLLKFGKDSTKVEPCLAEKYEVSKDGLTYTFDLRKGIKFHDGEPFNAAAVKANIDRYITPEAQKEMPYAEFVYGDVKNVETPEEYKVVIHLKKPSTPFLNNLAMSMTAPMASPKAIKEGTLMEKPVGTGPFVFDAWHKGQDITLKPNMEYWGAGPKASGVVFRFIAENSARVVALKNGEVNIIDGIDPNSVEEVKNSGAELVKTPGMNINYMGFNTKSALFKNEKARIAVSKAINVPELVENLYKGYARPAHSILPDFIPGYGKDVKPVGYNLEEAKKELAAAGVKKVRIMAYTNPRPYNPIGGQVLAEAVQGYLKKAGVEAEIISYDWTTYKEKLKTENYDMCFYGWIGDNGDPDNFLNLLVHPDVTMNVAQYSDPKLREMVKHAATVPNGDERNKLYAEIEQYIADRAVWVPISHMDILTAHAKNVEDYYFHMTGNIYMEDMYAKK